MLGAGGRVAARPGPWFEPATTAPEVLASVLSTNFSTKSFPPKSVARSAAVDHAGVMQLDTPALTITDLRADDPADVEAAFAIERDALAHDVPDFPPPCRYRHGKRLRHDFPGRKALRALGRLDGVPVGLLEVELTTYDNLDNADVTIEVLPEHRRRGVGHVLFAHACELAWGSADGRRSSCLAGSGGSPSRIWRASSCTSSSATGPT